MKVAKKERTYGHRINRKSNRKAIIVGSPLLIVSLLFLRKDPSIEWCATVGIANNIPFIKM